MHERSIKSWWRRRLPDISAAASRFPFAVAIAAALTAYKLYHGSMIGDAEFRVMAWLAASFVWVVSVDLYAESQRRSSQARVLLWLLGMAVLGVLLWLDTAIWLSAALLVASLTLALTLAGHLGRREKNETFWLFNHRLWLGALLAGVGAGSARHRSLGHSRDHQAAVRPDAFSARARIYLDHLPLDWSRR